MFTDIVGYAKLMGEDEQAAFDLLKKNRAVQRPIIEKFNGRWLIEIGDVVLASFPTAPNRRLRLLLSLSTVGCVVVENVIIKFLLMTLHLK
jgi:class 3 adenylate cyclase